MSTGLDGSRNCGTVEPGQVAWRYFELLNHGDPESAAALLDDSGTWWTCLARSTMSMAEHKTLLPEAMRAVPMRFTLHNVFSSDDVAVLEVESRAILPDGRLYNNLYAYVITVWRGQILHVREYSDTKHVAEVSDTLMALYGSQSAPGSLQDKTAQ